MLSKDRSFVGRFSGFFCFLGQFGANKRSKLFWQDDLKWDYVLDSWLLEVFTVQSHEVLNVYLTSPVGGGGVCVSCQKKKRGRLCRVRLARPG